MQAAVLSIGTEICRGELVNTNAAWLGEQLTALGFDVIEQITVEDDKDVIAEAVGRLVQDVKVVVATGGLGPTSDDCTSQAVAEAAGVSLRRDGASLERIRKRWAARGAEMPSSNEKQADVPEGAEVIQNPAGTAPGFRMSLRGARLFVLPGVPSEMQGMFGDGVVPAIAELGQRTTHQIHIRTFGMTESQVGEALADLESVQDGIRLGYRASFPEIEVKVLGRAETEPEAEDKARAVADKVRERLGDAVYGERDDTFPGVVARTLRERGLTVAVAESCTGGMVGTMLTSVPGSSDYMTLDAVCYANSAKSKVLGVGQELLRAHGAVSSETAASMAEGALRLGGSDLAVSITGIAGPGGGTDDKPVGTVWFGLARKDGQTVTKMRHLPGDRERIRTLAAYVALRMVWRAARGNHVEERTSEDEE